MNIMKKVWLISATVLVLALASGAIWYLNSRPASLISNEEATEEITPTRRTAPDGVDIPTPDTVGLPDNIAKPEMQQPAAVGVEASFRQYSVSVAANRFMPDTVIAKEGDTVHVEFTAMDNDYDLVQPDYGFSMKLPKGETKVLEFGAYMSGQFKFYCPKCGGPSAGPVGTFVIAAR